jgi:hypothetical protein
MTPTGWGYELKCSSGEFRAKNPTQQQLAR